MARDEKNTEVVRWKIGGVRIEEFQSVQFIEEHMVTFEIQEIRYGICKVDIMSFSRSICDPGEISIQGRITNHLQLHDKILGCLS